MNRHITTILGITALAVGVYGYASAAISPRYEVTITDFGRDLVGAEASALGFSPYQMLGTLSDQVPGISISDSDRSKWVAHSPMSVAAARVMLVVAGDDAEAAARFGVITSTALLIVLLAYTGFSSEVPGIWLTLAGALLVSLGVEQDVMWLQGASILALALGTALWMARVGHRDLALLVVGIAVAWRPWCAPMALFLPTSKGPLRDVLKVGVVATIVTAASLPVVGGFSSLQQWLTVAIPANSSQYLYDRWNMSFIGSYWPIAAIAAAILSITLALAARRRLNPYMWPRAGSIATLGLLPLVWPHYWLGLLICLTPGRRSNPSQPALLSAAFLAMAAPIAGRSPALTRAGGGLALLLATVALILDVRSGSKATDLLSRPTDDVHETVAADVSQGDV